MFILVAYSYIYFSTMVIGLYLFRDNKCIIVSFNSCWRHIYICVLSHHSTDIIENPLSTKFAFYPVVCIYIDVSASMKLEIECQCLLNECKIKTERPPYTIIFLCDFLVFSFCS